MSEELLIKSILMTMCNKNMIEYSEMFDSSKLNELIITTNSESYYSFLKKFVEGKKIFQQTGSIRQNFIGFFGVTPYIELFHKYYLERKYYVGFRGTMIIEEGAFYHSKISCNNNKVERDITNLEERFSAIIGLENVKEFIRSLQAQIRVLQARKQHGLASKENQTLHMIFKGNPGTGKTTMARIVSEVLYELGVVNSKKFVETDRSGLIAEYIGQTAIKTKQIVESALDGVLLIDEAYSLKDNYKESFGNEAIDTLVKLMEDHRDRLVVILTGYDEKMEEFLEMNPGLDSRFPSSLQIQFPDYTIEELVLLTQKMYEDNDYILAAGGTQLLEKLYEEVTKKINFGNGRFVRNLYEESLRKQAVRLNRQSSFTRDDLITILQEDLPC